MALSRLTGLGTPVDDLESHHTHQSPNMFPVDAVVLTFQTGGYLACPVEWRSQVLSVNQLHKSQVLLRDSFGLVVQTGVADI